MNVFVIYTVCWDTGHANGEGSQYHDLVDLGKHLYAVHIDDNNGKGDQHVIPFFGTVNMDEIMYALIDADYRGYFTFEATSALLHGRRRFEKDTRLFDPSLQLPKELARFLYNTGAHVLNAYNCFEA